MKRALPKLTLRRSNVPVLQRKCGCGQHTIAGGECESCRKQGIAVSAPDDAFEQEAEQAANKVMRVASPGNSTSGPASAPAVTPGVESRIRGRSGGGTPLPQRERQFFESRFEHDFSQVRIHADPEASDLSRKLEAEAFTFGNDIFFNSGRFNPSKPEGRHLLAHELAHTIQQNSGAVSRHIQRAKIPYGTLAWSDFKKAAPVSKFAAVTSSGFTIPGFSTTEDAQPTGNDCTLNKKPAKEFTATLSIDPTVFDSIAPFMVQEQSWVKDRFKTDAAGAAFCKTTKAAECQKGIDAQATKAATDCDAEKANCQKYFKSQTGTYTVTVNAVDIDASSDADCTTQAKTCRDENAKNFSFSLLDDDGNEVANAATKKECSEKAFQDPCAAHEIVESAWLLKHEQGHFDITNVMAPKAKADLKAKAATFTASETACGKNEAIKAARASFKALGALDTLQRLGKDWIASKDKAEDDYDTDTDHGIIHAQQGTWEATIAGGLTAYDLNPPAPVPAPAAPTQGTATPTPGVPAPAPAPSAGPDASTP